MLLLAGTARPALASDPTFEGRLFDASRIPRAINHQRSGRILTFMAIAHIAIGAGLLISESVLNDCHSRPGCHAGIPAFLTAGSLFLSSGLTFAAAGIPLWAVGSRERKRSISISAGGLGATF